LSAQSLADLAKKEKERRAKLKGKKSKVMTNKDIEKLKLEPALIQPQSTINTRTDPVLREDLSRTPDSSPRRNTTAAPAKKLLSASNTPKKLNPESAASQNDLETKLIQANEMIDLLSLKMNALWQEFYNMGDNRTRDTIQREISSTYQKLQKKREEAEQITKDLEKTPRKK
jgi:hypothetical protein